VTLSVYVQGREIGSLRSVGDFKSSMVYLPGIDSEDFVSLTMGVRDEPYVWDDVLHPFFQMNLPEGYLLQVLQEQFGPVVGASPMALLSVIGKNMIGRVQVAPEGAALDESVQAVDVEALLQGDNSEERFADLVRMHASSGVSGVVPKFLDASEERIQGHGKATICSHRHVIKGSSRQLPFVSLNEHLCMEVARRVMPSARTRISDDGQALVVDRFDVDENGERWRGMEDFCSLLGLRPSAKYETTWERIAKAVRNLVPAEGHAAVFGGMASLMLLTYALRNADCHAKNVALLYTGRRNIQLSPAYDVITTAAYPEFARNPPAIGFMGKKTWDPGANLRNFIATMFQVPQRRQAKTVEAIGDAMVEVGPLVRHAMTDHPGFADIGKRLLAAWSEGLLSLRDKRIYSMGNIDLGNAFEGFSDVVSSPKARKVIGRSTLLGKR